MQPGRSNLFKRLMLANAVHALAQLEEKGLHPRDNMLACNGRVHRAWDTHEA